MSSGVDLLVGVHADDADVSAEREGLDAVLGLAPLGGPELGPEAEEELGHLHVDGLGREEVAALVDHDHR